MILYLLLGICTAFIHFKQNKEEAKSFTKCDGIPDLFGVSQIKTNPKNAHPGHGLSVHAQGKMIKEAQNPICRVFPLKNPEKQKINRLCDQTECPLEAGAPWELNKKVDIPLKATALQGKSVTIQLECQEPSQPFGYGVEPVWDPKATSLMCIQTSIKVSVFLAKEQDQNVPATQESDSTPETKITPLILAATAGFIFGLAIALFGCQQIQRRKRREANELWIPTDTFVENSYVDVTGTGISSNFN